MMRDVNEATLAAPVSARVSPTRAAVSLGPLPLTTGTRLQEFEIHAVIGQGGFGIVYLARDLSLQRMVAIKEYMPAQLAGRNPDATVRPLTAGQTEVFELGRRSFINEARMLARFKHPGLLEVLRFWEQNGTAYMAMPFYDGATLTQYLKRHPGVATEEWLKRTLRPLVDALGHMHEEDCFHRDVAPDNILVLKDGSAVLLDLGAARRVIADDVQAMTVMLKPGYAPIEQYSDDPRFRQGPWTDVYAMAAVFFFGVTGKAPPASASRVMRDSVSPLHNVRPAGFSQAFLKAIDQGLSLQPEDRPRSIEEFRALLYAGEGGLMPTTPHLPDSPTRATPTSFPRAAIRADSATVARQDAGTEDPFAPPVTSSTTTYVVSAIVALVAAIAIGWFAMKPQAAGNVDNPRPVATTVAASPQTAETFPDLAQAVPEPAEAGSQASAEPLNTPDAPRPHIAPAAQRQVAAAHKAAAVSTTKGTLVLAIKPWAEVRVDGVLKGVSPPLKQLVLPSGRHTIEFRNPASAPVTRQVEVTADRSITVRHQF